MPDAFDLPDSPIRRVAVLGCCGAGKSTLAARLAPALGLPLVHLDREYWKPGWVEPDRATWGVRHAELIAEDRWLLDGNFGRTLEPRIERADLVILLVVPSHVALRRVIARAFKYRGRPRPDMGDGCAEQPLRRGTWAFWRYVWNFNRRQLPAIEERAERLAPGRTIVLGSAADIEALLVAIGSRQ